MSDLPAVSVVVMGVQGVGKSTIGEMLAARLGVPFIDGDSLHPPRNIEIMAAGKPLNDADREPWLHLVGETLATHRGQGGVVVACSALKRRYRDLLRTHAPDLYIVEPWGEIDLVAQRVSARSHEYMPATLLRSQFDALEPLAPDERGIRVSIEHAPDRLVETIIVDHAQTGVRR